MSRRSIALLLSMSVLGGATSAARVTHAADPQEQQLAQALFDEARRLMDKKRFSEACPKLAESLRLDPGGGTLLNLAVCHEKEGKLATAKVDYDEALAGAVRDGRKDRQQIARARIAAIEPSIPRVSVVVPLASDTEGIEVKLDGLVLRRAAWGVATPVDPGAHVIEATAPHRTPWTTSIVVETAQKKSVDVPALALLAPLPPEGTGEAAPPAMVGGIARQPMPVAPAPAPGEAPTEVVPVPRHANPVFYTALVVTLAGAGVSIATGALALSGKADAKSAGCVPDRKYCPNQAAYDTADRASTFAWASTITLGVAAAGAITMMIAPTKVANKPSAPAFGAAIAPGGGTFAVSGTF